MRPPFPLAWPELAVSVAAVVTLQAAGVYVGWLLTFYLFP